MLEKEFASQTANVFTEEKKCVLDFTYLQARQFFLKAESYCNMNLPSYFKFHDLINKVDNYLQNKKLTDYKEAFHNPSDHDDVNHVILSNKDGQYAWRPFQLIHPAIYVSLVHNITKEENWTLIKNRFLRFSQNPKITCISIPIESLDDSSD